MKVRLERLFIPYILWPLIIWFLNNSIFLIIQKNRFGRLLSIIELKVQLITGRKFFVQLWFLFHLIFFSIFFFIFSYLNEYIFFAFINLIGIIFYIIQYFKINYKFYGQYKESISFSIGHFISSYPIAVTAMLFNKSNFIKYLEKTKLKVLAIFLFLLLIILSLLFIFGTPDTYDGIDKNFFSLIVFLFFHLLPLNKYLSKFFYYIIYLMTRYTQGIYCLHTIIQYYLSEAINYKLKFLNCLELYIICYILSLLGKIIFGKSKIKYLFI